MSRKPAPLACSEPRAWEMRPSTANRLGLRQQAVSDDETRMPSDTAPPADSCSAGGNAHCLRLQHADDPRTRKDAS